MTTSQLRLAAVSDIQGNWDALASIAQTQKADVIVHTGNFGFWSSSTVERGTDVAYLKQLVAFLPILAPTIVAKLNDLSQISSGAPSADPAHDLAVLSEFKSVLTPPHVLSHMDQYLAGEKHLPVPVYTIVGPLDDPVVVSRFLTGEWKIPNLHIVDHNSVYVLDTPGEMPLIRLYGLGGNLKVHSLFDSGLLGEEIRGSSGESTHSCSDLSGRVGDLWITLAQVAQLYLNALKHTPQVPTVSIFLSHSPVVKTPLLEHLAIVTGADFTISQGLHFRYPVLANGMSFVDSMGGSAGYIENYRSKFSRLRMILGEMWVAIKDDVEALLDDDLHLRGLVELGLSLFDKIPVTISELTDKIVKLSLSDEDDDESAEINRLGLKKISDMYFSAYYKLWNFNLCDHQTHEGDDVDSDDQYNVMVFGLDSQGYFKLVHCSSQGFNFLGQKDTVDDGSRGGFELEQENHSTTSEISEDADLNGDGVRKTRELLNSTYQEFRARGRGRGRGLRRGSKRGRGGH